jgi:predicted phage terminase large subunit-like protein
VRVNLTVELDPPLHPLQAEIAAHPARFKVLACGRRWGKTLLGAALALEAACAGKVAWWVGPTYAQSSIAWRALSPVAQAVHGAALVRTSPRALFLPSGGSVWFKSGDSADNLRGEGLDLLIMDEADYQPGEVWSQVLRPALADRKGRAFFISTPKTENGWFHELFKRGQLGGGDWCSWSYPSWTNPFLDPSEFEAAKADLPSIEYRREFGAEFVSSAGARVKASWVRYADAAPPRLDVVLGVDLAISQKTDADYTAVVAMGRAQDGRLYVLDARRDRMSFDAILRFIQELAAVHHPRVISIESQQFQAAVVQELLRTTDLPVVGVTADRDKVTRFLPLEARYEQGLVYHLRSLPKEFEAELSAFPVGKHDDFVDAAAYAYRGLSTLDAATMTKAIQAAKKNAPAPRTRATF